MTHNRLAAGTGLVASLVLVAGCGPSVNPSAAARVSGSLTYKGQPIKAGRMQFHDKQGLVYAAQIDPDGTYAANDIAAGELVVTVETESVKASSTGKTTTESKRRDEESRRMSERRPGGAAAAPPPPENLYVKIPSKYASPKTSPLTVTLKSGRQVQNFDLE